MKSIIIHLIKMNLIGRDFFKNQRFKRKYCKSARTVAHLSRTRFKKEALLLCSVIFI